MYKNEQFYPKSFKALPKTEKSCSASDAEDRRFEPVLGPLCSLELFVKLCFFTICFTVRENFVSTRTYIIITPVLPQGAGRAHRQQFQISGIFNRVTYFVSRFLPHPRRKWRGVSNSNPTPHGVNFITYEWFFSWLVVNFHLSLLITILMNIDDVANDSYLKSAIYISDKPYQ